ncbi:hypothetical protein PCANC_22980 [Puccinia coronata f. sp. avenae]|uniref:Uncharacterized protein n=2 Tax=Puccinia coronata f. sp. avenae TaxID=200324 RepID=A0A2N5TIC8_9BASI|nr:hypothetical protein PCASD_11157 [Puccinia coronata f. sp. avenae]PLW25253.1 hypothetical protein PCANC_22980 [Puccinia coronata f. sp. avenae]
MEPLSSRSTTPSVEVADDNTRVDADYEPDTSKNALESGCEEEDSSSESMGGSGDSDQSQPASVPSHPKQSATNASGSDDHALGRGGGGGDVPLSYHEMSLRNAGLKDHLNQMTSQARNRIEHLKQKVDELIQLATQKSTACRTLKSRIPKKAETIAELKRARQAELQDIQRNIQNAAHSAHYAHLRSLKERLAYKQREENALLNERKVHALVRLDLEDQVETLQDKIRALQPRS